MTVLNAYCRVQPGKLETVFEASKINKATALSENGCLRFDYYLSVEDGHKVVFVEEWETKEALDTHLGAPSFAEFFKTVSECLTEAPEIRIFDATLYA